MSAEDLQAAQWRASAARLISRANALEGSEPGAKPDRLTRDGRLVLAGVALGLTDGAAQSLTSACVLGTSPDGLQHRLDPAIEARLAEVVQRLRSSWLSGPALLWHQVHPIHELALTDVEKRVALTLRLGFFQFSQFLAGFEVLLLQLEQLGLVHEELLLSLEELAIDLSDSSRLAVEIAEVHGRLRELLRIGEGRDE